MKLLLDSFKNGEITKQEMNSKCYQIRHAQKAALKRTVSNDLNPKKKTCVRKSSPTPRNGAKKVVFQSSEVNSPSNGEKEVPIDLSSEFNGEANMTDSSSRTGDTNVVDLSPIINNGEKKVADTSSVGSPIINNGEEKKVADTSSVVSPIQAAHKVSDHIMIQFLLAALGTGASLNTPLGDVLSAMGHSIDYSIGTSNARIAGSSPRNGDDVGVANNDDGIVTVGHDTDDNDDERPHKNYHENYFSAMANYVHKNGHCFVTEAVHDHMIKFGHCDLTNNADGSTDGDSDDEADDRDEDRRHSNCLLATAAYTQKYGHCVMTDAVSAHIDKFGHFNLAAGEAVGNFAHETFFSELQACQDKYSCIGEFDSDVVRWKKEAVRCHMAKFKYLL